jgi:hypothetical protein
MEIAPTKGWVALRLRELVDYRELLYFLTVREIKVRYKQTAIGAAWAIIQPLFTMIIFSLFFGRLAKVPSDGVPYSIFCFAGLVPWTMFANGIQQSSNSLVGNANLITKVYFPRLTVPISSVLSGLVDFALAFLLLLGFMLYRGFGLNVHALWLPAFLLLAVVSSLGVFPDTDLVVRHARRLSQQHAFRAMAHGIRSQPDGGRHRGFPLGAAGIGLDAGAHAGSLVGRRTGHFVHWRRILPPHGAVLRRYHLKTAYERHCHFRIQSG